MKLRVKIKCKNLPEIVFQNINFEKRATIMSNDRERFMSIT